MPSWFISGMLLGACPRPALVHPSVPFPTAAQCQTTVDASVKEWAGSGARLIALCLPRKAN